MAFRLTNAGDGWTDDDVERWLTDYPLPAEFEWRGCRVMPRYRLKKGFGFWLRTTPYHQGLFEEIRDILVRWPVGAALPSPEELADRLRLIEREAGLPLLTPPPDNTEPDPETYLQKIDEVDAGPGEPADNPTETQQEPDGNPPGTQQEPNDNQPPFLP